MKRMFKEGGYNIYVRQPLWFIIDDDGRVYEYAFSTKKYAELYCRRVLKAVKVVWDGKSFARVYTSRKKDSEQTYLIAKRWMCIRFGKEQANG